VERIGSVLAARSTDDYYHNPPAACNAGVDVYGVGGLAGKRQSLPLARHILTAGNKNNFKRQGNLMEYQLDKIVEQWKR
jgi:hypothetical protein